MHGWTAAPSGARPEHDAQRLGVVGAALAVGQAHGEARVVGPHRAGADEDGVALGPQAVGVEPGLGAGDPLARAVGGGGAAVERGRQLQHHVGPAGAAVVRGTGASCSAAASAPTPTSTSMPAARSRRCPAPATLRVGIGRAPTTTRATPAAIRASAHGRGAAVVGARLEGDVEGGAPGGVAGGGEGDHLGVGAGAAVGGAREAGMAVAGADDHRADPRTGATRRREAAAAARAWPMRASSSGVVAIGDDRTSGDHRPAEDPARLPRSG